MEICHFASPFLSCSDSKKQLLFLGECNRDISIHLKTYGLSKSGEDIADEVDLLLCRAGELTHVYFRVLLSPKNEMKEGTNVNHHDLTRWGSKQINVHARNRKFKLEISVFTDNRICRNLDFGTKGTGSLSFQRKSMHIFVYFKESFTS